ncbi:unnamed protein product [Diamesa tonsa]
MDFKYFFMTILSFFLAFVRGEGNEAPKALNHPETWSNAKQLNSDLFDNQLPAGILLEGNFTNVIEENRQQNLSFLKSNNQRKKENLKRRKNKYENKNKCVYRPTAHEDSGSDSDHGNKSDSD